MTRTFSQLTAAFHSYGKVLSLLLMMVLGILFPLLSNLSFLIQYLLMAMLFFALLDIEIRPRSFRKGVLWVVLANILVTFTAYWILRPFSMVLALTAFITGIAPIATAAPVIIGFLQGQVDYVVGAVLLSNITMSLVVPLTLPFVVGNVDKVSIWQVLKPVLVTMFVPLILARLSRVLPGGAQIMIRRGKSFSFTFWLLALLISSAKASDFLHNDVSASAASVIPIALRMHPTRCRRMSPLYQRKAQDARSRPVEVQATNKEIGHQAIKINSAMASPR